MAILAHVLQVVGWFAPLIIFLIRRESRFVAFHALQALLLQIVYQLVMCVFMVLWCVTIFATIAQKTPAGSHAPLPAFFFIFPIIWVGFMGMWILTLVVAIVYGIKASRAEWAAYPLIGGIARRILKISAIGSDAIA